MKKKSICSCKISDIVEKITKKQLSNKTCDWSELLSIIAININKEMKRRNIDIRTIHHSINVKNHILIIVIINNSHKNILNFTISIDDKREIVTYELSFL
jgi:hypothetical protein